MQPPEAVGFYILKAYNQKRRKHILSKRREVLYFCVRVTEE